MKLKTRLIKKKNFHNWSSIKLFRMSTVFEILQDYFDLGNLDRSLLTDQKDLFQEKKITDQNNTDRFPTGLKANKSHQNEEYSIFRIKSQHLESSNQIKLLFNKYEIRIWLN